MPEAFDQNQVVLSGSLSFSPPEKLHQPGGAKSRAAGRLEVGRWMDGWTDGWLSGELSDYNLTTTKI